MNDVSSICHACGATYRGRVEICPNCKAAILPDLPDFHPGEIIDGKYEILSLLGVGGMGEVFKVRHLHLNTLRTIKVMRRTLLADETYRSRFAREARLATRLQHPNVALVYDFSSLSGGVYYMVSELIDGITARQWGNMYGPMPPVLAVEIALQTLSGLEHIHRAGLLHRDLSADNIMISCNQDGEPVAKIIDLGIAKRLHGPVMGDATQAGIFVGNPRYSSPEQLGALGDDGEIDARADLYCFGVVLYEILAGVPPFISNTPEGYAAKHLALPPPPLRSQPGAKDVPAEFEAVVVKALEKDRDRRHASALAFATALAPFRSASPQMTHSIFKVMLSGSRSDHGGVPVTMTPLPNDEAPYSPAVPTDEPALLASVDEMVRKGDISSLSRLATAHSAETVVGRIVRAALDRMADESLLSPAPGELEDWTRAVDANTEEAWTEFLSRHSQSGRASEARRMRDELRDFASASRAATEGAWRSFLMSWPASRHATAAEEHIRALSAGTPSAVAGGPAEVVDTLPPLDQTHIILEAPPSSREHVLSLRQLSGTWQMRACVEAAFLILIIAVVYWIVRDAQSDAAAPLPVPTAAGTLLIDAAPWARIASVYGNEKEWIPDTATYTPAGLTLPPGRYAIVVIGPDGVARKEVIAVVDEELSRVVRVEFARVDVDDYFRSLRPASE